MGKRDGNTWVDGKTARDGNTNKVNGTGNGRWSLWPGTPLLGTAGDTLLTSYDDLIFCYYTPSCVETCKASEVDYF